MTADNISAGTPNGGWAYPALRKSGMTTEMIAKTLNIGEEEIQEILS